MSIGALGATDKGSYGHLEARRPGGKGLEDSESMVIRSSQTLGLIVNLR